MMVGIPKIADTKNVVERLSAIIRPSNQKGVAYFSIRPLLVDCKMLIMRQDRAIKRLRKRRNELIGAKRSLENRK